jgi:hypothetical protein
MTMKYVNQMAIEYIKLFHSKILQFYQILGIHIWFENIPSGNPGKSVMTSRGKQWNGGFHERENGGEKIFIKNSFFIVV